MKPEQNGDSQITRIMGISDYKATLEKLTNGLGAPCFGIEGQEVTEEMVERGLPEGIYVMNSMADRPAYNAGIQNGDIITAINDREVTTMKEFQGMVDAMECGQLLHVIDAEKRTRPVHGAGISGDSRCAVESYDKMHRTTCKKMHRTT